MFYSSEAHQSKFQVGSENHVFGEILSPEDQASTGMVSLNIWHVPGWWAFCAEDGYINVESIDFMEDRGFNLETFKQIAIAYLNHCYLRQ